MNIKFTYSRSINLPNTDIPRFRLFTSRVLLLLAQPSVVKFLQYIMYNNVESSLRKLPELGDTCLWYKFFHEDTGEVYIFLFKKHSKEFVDGHGKI